MIITPHNNDKQVPLKKVYQVSGVKKNCKPCPKYKGGKVVVTANNTRLLIAHIGEMMITPHNNDKQVPLKKVYQVSGVKKNLFSVTQLADEGN